MKKSISLFVFLCFCVPVTILGQHTVKGRVVDAQGKPVPEAIVSFEALAEQNGKSNKGCVSDEQMEFVADKMGRFTFAVNTNKKMLDWKVGAQSPYPKNEEAILLLPGDCYAGVWERRYVKGKTAQLKTGEVVDVGDVSLTLFIQPILFVLKGANGEKLGPIKRAKSNVEFELFDAKGDKISANDSNATAEKIDTFNDFFVAIPEGKWTLQVRISGNYELEGTAELDVKPSSDTQKLEVALRQVSDAKTLSGTTTNLDRTNALKELERLNFGVTADSLFERIKGGNSRAVELLLAAGVSPNAKNREGTSALAFAIYNDETRIARILIKRGADVNVKDADGDTALTEAMEKGNDEIVQELIAKGASSASAQDSWMILHYVAANKYDRTEAVRTLIEKGADVNAKSETGETALMQAVNCFIYQGIERCTANVEVMRLLIAKGADVNAKDVDGQTVLFDAIKSKSAEAVRLLIDKGADVNLKNKRGQTPLQTAESKGDKGIIALLKNKNLK